jgi:hypothetical protein
MLLVVSQVSLSLSLSLSLHECVHLHLKIQCTDTRVIIFTVAQLVIGLTVEYVVSGLTSAVTGGRDLVPLRYAIDQASLMIRIVA